MQRIPSKSVELLAPAGSLEVFQRAVEAGANAIYIGAPSLNARALAKKFSWPEMAAMVSYGHQHQVKVYVAMNSLRKEAEIPLAGWIRPQASRSPRATRTTMSGGPSRCPSPFPSSEAIRTSSSSRAMG